MEGFDDAAGDFGTHGGTAGADRTIMTEQRNRMGLRPMLSVWVILKSDRGIRS